MLFAATASVAAPALTGGAFRPRRARVVGARSSRAARVASRGALRVDAAIAESAAPALSLGDLSAPVLKSHGSGNEVAQTSANVFAAPPSNPNRAFAQGVAPQYVAAAVVVAAGVVVKRLLDTPSRAYVEGPGGASVGTVGEEYDRVLCDVPCSGDGTLRKAPFNLKTWHISHALQYHLLQTLLLQRSIELTAIGGIIVYSTCSLNPIENEAVIAHVVSQAAGAIEICPCPSALSALKHRPGMLHWRVPDSNFPGKWYDRFDDVVAARTAKAHAREAFRSPCHSLFAGRGCACGCVAWHRSRACTLTLSCAGC